MPFASPIAIHGYTYIGVYSYIIYTYIVYIPMSLYYCIYDPRGRASHIAYSPPSPFSLSVSISLHPSVLTSCLPLPFPAPISYTCLPHPLRAHIVHQVGVTPASGIPPFRPSVLPIHTFTYTSVYPDIICTYIMHMLTS